MINYYSNYNDNNNKIEIESKKKIFLNQLNNLIDNLNNLETNLNSDFEDLEKYIESTLENEIINNNNIKD